MPSTDQSSTLDEQIAAIIERARASGDKIVLHRCTMCGYPCGWYVRRTVVTYDCGCDCRWEGEHGETEADIVSTLRMNPGLVAQMGGQP